MSSKGNPILLLCDENEQILCLFPTHKAWPTSVRTFGRFKAKLKIAFKSWHMMNAGKQSAFTTFPKWYMTVQDFTPTNVYTSNNSANILSNSEGSSATVEPQPSICVPSTDMNEVDLLILVSWHLLPRFKICRTISQKVATLPFSA